MGIEVILFVNSQLMEFSRYHSTLPVVIRQSLADILLYDIVFPI
jgi:hypothetical protein